MVILAFKNPPHALSTMTPVTATLKGYQAVCFLTAMFTRLRFCLTGDLHRDSGHAALWCFLHGLPLHNGEQQRQRYCPIHSSSQTMFAHLATSSLFFSVFLCLVCLSLFSPSSLSILFFLCLSLSLSFLFSVKQAPWRLEERACLVSIAPTWSLTLPVPALTPNFPGGQLSELFSLL